MKVFLVDISNKVPVYDNALCTELFLSFSDTDDFFFLSPQVCSNECRWHRSLCILLPKKLEHKYNIYRRLFKLLEVLVNYVYLILLVYSKKIDILHLQWLPMLEICDLEHFFLSILCKRAKIVLTVHNIYPHSFGDRDKSIYRKRFIRIDRFISAYITHTKASRNEMIKEFNIREGKLRVVHHGILGSTLKESHTNDTGNYLNLLLFGVQSFYKGTDILVKAIEILRLGGRDTNVHVQIIGQTSPDLYSEYKERAEQVGIEWTPTFVGQIFLDQQIKNADIIILPYRDITQSGVLLKAIGCGKAIIASNLLPFKETLSNYSNDMFFECSNPESLADLIKRYVNHSLSHRDTAAKTVELQTLYSWRESANQTKNIYNTLLGPEGIQQ